MSTKAAAIQSLLERVGIPVYTASSVPDDAEMPYMTYTPVNDSFDHETSLIANIWCYGDGEVEPNALAQTLSELIGRGGRVIRCDDGAIWVKRDQPFCQAVTDEDDKVKRRYINLIVEFLTID